MKIEGAYSNPSVGMNNSSQNDPVSRNLKQQIQSIKKELQELNADKSIPPQDKSEKQQELNKQLNELNQQLRQHEMEKQQEQRKKATEKRQTLPETPADKKVAEKGESFDTQTIQAMAAAESNQKIVTKKEGVLMELSHEARELSNAIKREELEGGVSASRPTLNQMYGHMGELSGEIAGTLNSSYEKLKEANSAQNTDQPKESEEESIKDKVSGDQEEDENEDSKKSVRLEEQ